MLSLKPLEKMKYKKQRSSQIDFSSFSEVQNVAGNGSLHEECNSFLNKRTIPKKLLKSPDFGQNLTPEYEKKIIKIWNK